MSRHPEAMADRGRCPCHQNKMKNRPDESLERVEPVAHSDRAPVELKRVRKRLFCSVLPTFLEHRKRDLVSNLMMFACAHCGAQASYNLALSPSSQGSSGFQCRSCRQSFRVYYTQGQVREVKKH